MKQSDVAILILVVSFTLVISYFVGTTFISSPENRTKTVEIIEPIPENLSQADENVFNQKAINPSVNIKIGGPEKINDKPFPGEESQ